MEKVVAKELGEKITITSEDISIYYKKLYPTGRFESIFQDEEKNINEMIIKHLRREKAEKAYKSWLNELQDKYPIEVNETKWKELTG